MAAGRLPQQLEHWLGFWAPGLDAGTAIVIDNDGRDAGSIIARTDSYQSIWIGSLQPHLFRHAVVLSVSSNRDCWLLTHAPLFMVRFYCTREYLRPFTSSDETSWCWSTLIAVYQRGRVSSYQLSVFGFQIVAVFGRIQIVHLAHYSVRFEFEWNIRYSPSRDACTDKALADYRTADNRCLTILDWRISTHANRTSTRCVYLIGTPWSHQLEHSSSFTRWPIRLILGFWGSKVHKNVLFPALDADEPTCKIWRC